VAAGEDLAHRVTVGGDLCGVVGAERQLVEQLGRGGQRRVARDVTVGSAGGCCGRGGGGGGESGHGSCPGEGRTRFSEPAGKWRRAEHLLCPCRLWRGGDATRSPAPPAPTSHR